MFLISGSVVLISPRVPVPPDVIAYGLRASVRILGLGVDTPDASKGEHLAAQIGAQEVLLTGSPPMATIHIGEAPKVVTVVRIVEVEGRRAVAGRRQVVPA